MKTLYGACLSRLGLSQAEAVALHRLGASGLSTVKHWCSGRRPVPPGVWADLRALELRIVDGSEELRERWEAAGSPPIELDDSAGGGLALMAAADFVLSCEAPVAIGRSAATIAARKARGFAG